MVELNTGTGGTVIRTDELMHRLYLSLKSMPCTCILDWDLKVTEQCRKCRVINEYEHEVLGV